MCGSDFTEVSQNHTVALGFIYKIGLGLYKLCQPTREKGIFHITLTSIE